MIEVKAGYKQTEVGVIPEDWEINILKRIVKNNRIPAGIYKEKKEYGNGTKIIKLGNVFWGDYFEPHNAQRVSLNRKELLNNQVYVGDIIIALASVKLEGVGKVMYVNKLDEETAFDHNVALIRANKDFNSEYIFYYLKSDKIRDVIRQSSTQVGTTFLKSSTIQEFNILLPPIKQEQNAIVTVLSDTDALIEHLEKRIAKKKVIKQGTMQQLLTGKKRLPGFSGEWDVKKLDDIFSITAGRDLVKDSYSQISDDNHPFPIYSNSLENKGLYGYTKMPRHKENSITITARGTIGQANARDHKFDAIGRLLILDPLKELDCVFISEYLNNRVVFSIESTGVPQLTAPQASKYLVAYPDADEQTAIATILSDMDSEIEALEQTRNKYTMIKQGMMQQLLTGRIRIHGTN